MLSLTHDYSSTHVRTPEQLATDLGQVVHENGLVGSASPKKKFSLHIPAAHPVETSFRHSWWKHKRKKVRDHLSNSGMNKFALDRFDQCGGECVVEYSKEAGRHRLKANYCHNRHCEPCMKAKANKLSGNLRRRLDEEPEGRYRFITLTLRHSDQPLLSQIKRLYAAFKKLRSMAFWKTSQRGGAACLEVKWNDKTRHWHPHIHVISEGEFIDKFELSRSWHSATGDSQIVDIRALKSGKDAAHYVAKYVSKGTSASVWNDDDAAQEWIASIKGVRTCLTFGTWRGYKLTTAPALFNDWKPVWTLVSLAADASRGEVAALTLYCKLDGWKLEDEATRHTRDSGGP